MANKITIRRLARRSLIAGAALAATAGAVQAQSVTLFGRIDTGIEYQTDVAPSDDSIVRMQNGGILPSIWGMRGSEDLGGGLKAVFNLESDFSSDTGGSRGLGNISTAFGRQANVGLSGGFGTVLLGRQYSPALLADLGTEPRGFKESYSSLLQFALPQLPAGNDLGGSNNGAGIFTSNMISYSGAFGPVNFLAGYGIGEVAGETSDNSTIALGANYTGPITVSGSYQLINGTGQAESKRYSLGVSVPFGAITLKAYYANVQADDAAGAEVTDADTMSVGVNWAWNAQNTFTFAYYYGKDDGPGFGGKSNDFVISNDYALSKRTTLYAQLVRVDLDADANAAVSLASYRGTGTDGKTTIIGVGLKHDF